MSSRVRRLPSYAVAAIVAITVGLGSGAAYAFWSASGTGTGTASVGTPSPVTVASVIGSTSTPLVPGGSADLIVTVTNPNSFPVTITGITQTGAPTGGGSGCLTSGITVPATALTAIVASSSTVAVTVTSGARMSVSSDNGCQGSTFQIPISVTVRR